MDLPRTGIKKRHICKDETLIDMAYKASLKALNNINKEDIGIIIVATMSSPIIHLLLPVSYRNV